MRGLTVVDQYTRECLCLRADGTLGGESVRYENWQFDVAGLMELRFASISEHPIAEAERKFHWVLGQRPDGHPGLTDLGL